MHIKALSFENLTNIYIIFTYIAKYFLHSRNCHHYCCNPLYSCAIKNVRKIQKIKNNIDFHRASNLQIRAGGTEHTATTSTISVSRVIMVGMEIIEDE